MNDSQSFKKIMLKKCIRLKQRIYTQNYKTAHLKYFLLVNKKGMISINIKYWDLLSV